MRYISFQKSFYFNSSRPHSTFLPDGRNPKSFGGRPTVRVRLYVASCRIPLSGNIIFCHCVAWTSSQFSWQGCSLFCTIVQKMQLILLIDIYSCNLAGIEQWEHYQQSIAHGSVAGFTHEWNYIIIPDALVNIQVYFHHTSTLHFCTSFWNLVAFWAPGNRGQYSLRGHGHLSSQFLTVMEVASVAVVTFKNAVIMREWAAFVLLRRFI